MKPREWYVYYAWHGRPEIIVSSEPVQYPHISATQIKADTAHDAASAYAKKLGLARIWDKIIAVDHIKVPKCRRSQPRKQSQT